MTATSKAEAKSLGLKRYFTGVPCGRGHIAERSIHGMCCECSDIAKKARRAANPGLESKRYREKHRERILAREQRWRDQNRESENKRLRDYYHANKERLAVRAKEIRDAEPERFKAYTAKTRVNRKEQIRKRVAEYHVKNREKRNKQGKEYRLKNMDRWRVYAAKRRALKAGIEFNYNSAEIRDILKMQKHKCGYCKISLKRLKWHIDHITPLSKGGPNERSNLQILCPDCNLSKHAKDPIVFAQQLGMLL